MFFVWHGRMRVEFRNCILELREREFLFRVE